MGPMGIAPVPDIPTSSEEGDWHSSGSDIEAQPCGPLMPPGGEELEPGPAVTKSAILLLDRPKPVLQQCLPGDEETGE